MRLKLHSARQWNIGERVEHDNKEPTGAITGHGSKASPVLLAAIATNVIRRWPSMSSLENPIPAAMFVPEGRRTQTTGANLRGIEDV